MRYQAVIRERRGAARIEDAEIILGGPQMLTLARRASWLQPVIQRKRMTLFDYDDCLACWKRISTEGFDALLAAAKGHEANNELN